jgi:major intracellular serine protease
MELISKFNVNIDENLTEKDYINFYGKKKIDSDFLSDKGFTGKKITIAIIDTGCDINHPILKNNIIGGKNFTTEDSDSVYSDYNGHGTHVAGIIKSVAKDVNLLILKVLDTSGNGKYDWIVNAVNYAVDQKVDIISMSLGGTVQDANLYNAIINAIKNDVLVVCAAGNDGDGDENTQEENFPGAYNEVIEVGAMSLNDCVSKFSNSNKNVDLIAPGEDIISTLPGNKYGKMSGTSQATPYVSGSLALIKEYCENDFDRKLNESELYAQLIKRTKTLGDIDRTEQGNGFVCLSV